METIERLHLDWWRQQLSDAGYPDSMTDTKLKLSAGFDWSLKAYRAGYMTRMMGEK